MTSDSSRPADFDESSDATTIYNLARDALALQLDAADGLDAKVATLLSVGCALLGILGAVLVLRPQTDETIAAFVAAVGIPWMAMSILSFRAYSVVQFDACPDLNQVWTDHDKGMSANEIRGNIAESYKTFFYSNDGHIQRKAHAVRWGIRLLVLQTVALTTGFVLLAT